MKKLLQFKETFRIPTYDVKNDYSLKLSAFVNHMQEISSLHASYNGCGAEHIISRGYAWMISRYHIDVKKFPKMNEIVNLETWVYGNPDPFTLREYKMTDADGNILVRATCSWLIYDLKAKQVTPVSQVVDHPILPERMVNDSFEKLPEPTQEDNEKTFSVRMHDLDINSHVNNKVYAEWALEAVPVEIVQHYDLKHFEIVFKRQAFYGDTIHSVCQIEKETDGEITILHAITSETQQKLLTQVRTRWTQKDRS